MKLFKTLIVLFVMTSCTQKEKVDLIVSGDSVYTVDNEFSKAESFAVKDGKILAIGSTKDILDKYDAEQVLDADGKYVYPGFNDAHCHFNGYAVNLLQYADLRGTESPEEIYGLLKQHHDKFGGDWILGRSWDQNDWAVKDFPDKNRLDELFPDIPVYLVRVDGHAGWCNSKALELAGVTAKSKVNGGDVLLKNGEPSGILIDNAMGFVVKFIPEVTSEQLEKGLLEAQRNCFAAGLTSVTDCGLDKETILLMDKMQNAGELKMRVNAMLNPTQENFDYFVKKGEAYKTDRLLVNTIKIYADGALGSRGALMMTDYSDDPGNSGLQIETQEYYDMICQLAYDNNFAVATHAIGDGGNRLMLDTYGKYLKGKNDRRWRIEHSQIINADDFAKFAEFSVVPSIQPTHCTSDMPWAEDRVGAERIQGAYAYQTLLNQLGWVPAGTDFPVEDIYPLYTFYSAVFRTDHKGWPEGGWHKAEGLTREQTLRAMTSWAAKSSFEENEKGSLEAGKIADFIILDTDLMTAEPNEVLDTKILSTWSAGEKVFEL
ncbi:amidohydrolase [Draconibacterium sp. IB214405]|uniref:amidohydrolase n=1 Tax=Draconibacterium sp. IB214405 TaxID=3097352 RepID=UPI002A0C28BB|nr:amidohydrolase [Draconibacterium sp. IB214405]MDX8337836.1 amidohydrolase [Draconibacterium sp. IB214405]